MHNHQILVKQDKNSYLKAKKLPHTTRVFSLKYVLNISRVFFTQIRCQNICALCHIINNQYLYTLCKSTF